MKYTVEHDEELDNYIVVEWEDYMDNTRIGKTISKYRDLPTAVEECNLLNEGYEYECSWCVN